MHLTFQMEKFVEREVIFIWIESNMHEMSKKPWFSLRKIADKGTAEYENSRTVYFRPSEAIKPQIKYYDEQRPLARASSRHGRHVQYI